MTYDGLIVSAHNEVPYINSPYAQTHPSRLFVMGKLAGLNPPAVESCRVLELGASEGENLMGMAIVLPSAEFVGIELAELPVARGQKTISDLGLSNMRLEQMNILDVDKGLGQFDYIIAHGIYSWTPPEVRDHVLAIARANLNPGGIAYVSYNTYPGRHVYEVLREMMQFHIGEEKNPAMRLQKAREVLRTVATGRPEPDTLDAAVAGYAVELLERTDSALYHDDLCEFYQAVYFHDFVAHASCHGLRIVSEANPQDAVMQNVRPEALAQIREMAAGDRIREEQYLDFARTRKFRQTLLCHAESATGVGSVAGCYAAAIAHEAEDGAFVSPGGMRMTTQHAAPREYLRRLLKKRPGSEEIAAEDADLATRLFQTGMIEIRAFPGIAKLAGDRPCASAFARYQAARGDTRVTTLGHRTMALAGENARKLITLADGSRDRAEIERLMECSRDRLDAALEELGINQMFIA